MMNTSPFTLFPQILLLLLLQKMDNPMKKNLLYLAFCILFLTSCNSGNKAKFYVELLQCDKGTPVLLYVSDAAGAIEISNPDTLLCGKNGKLSFEIPLQNPKTVLIKASNSKSYYQSTPIYITQEGTYHLQLSPSNNKTELPILFIDGENSLGIIELNRFYDEKKSAVIKSWYDDKAVTDLMSGFDQLVSKSLRTINQLKKVKRIDEPFYEYAVHQIEYYLAYHTLQYMETRFNKIDTSQKRLYQEYRSQIYNRCPISYSELYQTSVAKLYIDQYLSELITKNKSDYDLALKKSEGQTFILGQLKRELHKNTYQYYALEYLWSKVIRLDQESITLWNGYKKEFLELKNLTLYQKMEQEAIPNIQKFYAEGNVVLKPGVTILDEKAPITSFSDAISVFRGQYILIDIWASWCPDCINEFAHNEELKTFLKGKNIAQLYISLERSPDRTKWKRYINKYNLTGFHILINEQLREDLYRVLGTRSIWIPRYILVDPIGTIIIPEGPLPSEGKKLYDQITQKMMVL